jgi:hypothetical protein
VSRPLLGPVRTVHLLSNTGLRPGERPPPPQGGAFPGRQPQPAGAQDVSGQGGAAGGRPGAAEQ